MVEGGYPTRPAEKRLVVILAQKLNRAVGYPGTAVVLFRNHRYLRQMIEQITHTVYLPLVAIPVCLQIHQILIVLPIIRNLLH